MNAIAIHPLLWKETQELLAGRENDCQRLNEKLNDAFIQLLKQDIQLAAQRRTIATLRARLQNRKGGYWSRGKQQDHWLDGWRNRYDALRTGYINLSQTCDGYSSREEKARHRQRIAAIRNFGSLPGEEWLV